MVYWVQATFRKSNTCKVEGYESERFPQAFYLGYQPKNTKLFILSILRKSRLPE